MSIFLDLSSSISPSNAKGSITTPLPMAHFVPLVKDSGWDEMEHILFVVDDYGMAGVVAALVAGDKSAFNVRTSTIFPFPSSPHWRRQ